MKRKVYKNGNSLVVGLTESAKEVLEIKEGDSVNMRVKNKQVIITKIDEKKGDK